MNRRGITTRRLGKFSVRPDRQALMKTRIFEKPLPRDDWEKGDECKSQD